MTIVQDKDVENGEINYNIEDLEQPFIKQVKKVEYVDDESETSGIDQNGSIWMVLLSTFVAVCGSFEFGSCVSIFIFYNKFSKPFLQFF